VGSGGYGVVRAVTCKESGKRLAMKSIKKRPRHFTGKQSVYRKKIQTEFEAHLSLGKSLDIVYAYEAFEDAESVHLVMELCSGGTLLNSRFLQRGDYSEKQVAAILRTALRSIIQCNVHGIAFRDIKPENFLWTEQGHLKLSDFGLAAFCKEDDDDDEDGDGGGNNGGGAGRAGGSAGASSSSSSSREAPFLTERCGTVSFLAPEVIKQRYGQSCDVWSTGVMAYFLLSGHYPFRDEEGQSKVPKEIWRAVLYEEPDFESDPWPRISAEAKDFIRLLLEKDPRQRLSAKAALQHPWVREDYAGEAHDEVLEESLVARLQRFGLYGKLKQALLQKMLKYLDPRNEEVEKVNAFLDSLDYKGTGTVQVDDLVWMLSSGGYDLEADEWTQICDNIINPPPAQANATADANDDAKGHARREEEGSGSGSGTLRIQELAPFLVDWPKVQREGAWDAWVREVYGTLCSSNVCSLEDVVKFVCESEDEQCSLEVIDEIDAILGGAARDPLDSIELDNFSELLSLKESELLSYYDSRLEYYGEA